MKTLSKLFLAALSLFIFTSSVSALGGVGGVPIKPNDPSKPNWFIYNLKPGETYKDVMIVKNHEKKTWLVDMYPADSVKSAGGGFALKQKSEEMEKMGSWIKLSKNQVLLEPGESTKIPFTISIPEDTEPGETAGAIMMVKLEPDTNKQSVDMEQGGIKLTFRTGVRVYNTVPGDITEKLDYEKFAVEKRRKPLREAGFFQKASTFLFPNFSKNNYLLVSQTVKNTGNVSTFAKYNVNVENMDSVPFASVLGAFDDVLYEKADSRFLVQRDTSFDNNHEIYYYKSDETGKEISRQLPVLGKIMINSQVSMVNREGEEVPVEVKKESVWIIPWQEIIIALGLILLIILIIVWKKIYYSGKGWVEYKVRENDNIQKIADQYPGYSWKRIVKVNKMKSPYLLEKDQVILVPPVKAEKNEATTSDEETE